MTTRDRLVDGAAELLWERGYVGTSPRAVLDRAGAGQGSLYHFFAGKQELAVAAIEHNAAVLRAAVDRDLELGGTALHRLDRFLTRERDVLRGCRIGRMAQDPDVVRTEALRAPVDDTLGWVRRRLAEVVRDGQRAGELTTDVPAEDVADAVLAVLQGGYVLARAAASPEPFDSAVRGARALLRRLSVAPPTSTGGSTPCS